VHRSQVRSLRHVIVGGRNYGQGSSREHAAIAPRYLALRLVIAKSYARIHWQNLTNFGVLPLEFAEESGYDRIAQGDELTVDDLPDAVREGSGITIRNLTTGAVITVRHRLSARHVAMVLAGGQIPLLKHTRP
jgi:aconitate hydratase